MSDRKRLGCALVFVLFLVVCYGLFAWFILPNFIR